MPLTKENCAASYKLLILGVSGVGKSAILQSLVGNQFAERYLTTVGKDFVAKITEVDGALVNLNVWDTPSQEQFSSVRRQLYGGTQGVMLVYDVTNRDSFTPLLYWITTIEQEIRHNHSKYEPIPIVLCGNKKDMEDLRQVQTEEGEMLVNEKKVFEFFETSAKTRENVFQAFHRLAYYVTDICNPHLMKSYHPFMIKMPDDPEPEQRQTPVIGWRKVRMRLLKKNKMITQQGKGRGKDGTRKCSVLACCVSAHA